MKKLVIMLLMGLMPYLLCAKTRITTQQYNKVMEIAASNGVPASVARQLMVEESSGFVDAVSPKTPSGYCSEGLFQLYMRPDNINYLLNMFWPYDRADFDVNNPEHNAIVAMGYLSWLHKRFGTWYKALIFYNHGSLKNVSDCTKAYALRIINAK